ncbi:MAG: hypothetical protein JOZ24_00530 [Candidatus Eremiobacteraeota bacterium]|nr:hypothetical protein [Candidatus Eremiobacteraeota bacterium]
MGRALFAVAVLAPFATVQPPAQAAAAVSLQSLTPQAVQALPDSTLIAVGNRTVAMGILRQQHQLRLQRFAAAGALATRFKLSAPAGAPPLASVPAPIPAQGATPTQAPTAAPTPAAPLVVPAIENLDRRREFPLPADAKAFCSGAGDTACYYLPPASTLQLGQGVITGLPFDSDPLILDRSVCRGEGGLEYGQDAPNGGAPGCYFIYPIDFRGNFLPPAGKVPTFSTFCGPASAFTVQTDPRGAILFTPQFGALSPSDANFCLGNAYLPPG